jgi:hypothetical protein
MKTRKVAAMRRRVVLGVLAAAFLVSLGRVRAAAQPGAALDQPGERKILQRQKRAARRLRSTEKKWLKRRKQKAKQLFKRTDEEQVRILR